MMEISPWTMIGLLIASFLAGFVPGILFCVLQWRDRAQGLQDLGESLTNVVDIHREELSRAHSRIWHMLGIFVRSTGAPRDLADELRGIGFSSGAKPRRSIGPKTPRDEAEIARRRATRAVLKPSVSDDGANSP